MNLKYKVLATLFMGLLMFPVVLKAEKHQKIKTYVAERVVGKPPVIDGKLNDKAWSEGKWGSGFYQFQPYNGKKATQKTDFKILYDNY